MDEDVDIATDTLPHKRPRSPSPKSAAATELVSHRQPKRQRRARARDHALEEAVVRGPLSRRVLKRDAKRARRAAGRAARAERDAGMEVDAASGGLEFTFMADVEGLAA
jgi:nuclear GTP-binding protein